MKIDYEEVVNELKSWLENNKIRNSEWNNFINKDGMIGIPISYILNKINDLLNESEVE